jgi:DivIVA domain-containing protein
LYANTPHFLYKNARSPQDWGVSDGRITADEVRVIRFSRPPVGKRGYREGDVDALVQRILDRLDGTGTLTAQQVREARFNKPDLFKRGYAEDEVDEFLDRVATTLKQMDRR